MANQKAAIKTLSDEQLSAVLDAPSVAARIRYLNSEGYTRGDISRILSGIDGHQFVRYQWVRNVLETKMKG